MRTRNIILGIFIAVAIFSALSVNAQSDSLLADETNVTVLNSYYRITSSNYFIPDELIKQYGDKAKYYTVRNKKDRQGDYREVVFYFPLSMKNELEQFIIHLERPKTAKK